MKKKNSPVAPARPTKATKVASVAARKIPAKSERGLKLSASTATRKRRSGEEIRQLIIDSARELFGERGYAATTTRAIADRAGVTEPLIFRNFGGKAALFEQAVALPFNRLLGDYLTVWRNREPTTKGSMIRMRHYVESLYDYLRENKALLRALILSMQSDDPELAHLMHQPSAPIIRYLDQVGKLGETSLPQVGWVGINLQIAVRISFGFIFSLAVFDDLFFAEGRHPKRVQLIDEMVAYLVHGLGHRPKSRR